MVASKVLVGLVNRSLGTHDFINSCSGIIDLIDDVSLVLVNLALHLLELVNLFSHLLDSILVLSSQVAHDRFLLNIGLFNVLSQLLDLSFSLLVKLNLGMGSTSSFIKTLTKLLNFSGKVRSLSLSLGAGLALSLKLSLKFLNSSLAFLDILLHLGNKGLLIIKLGRDSTNVLFLPGDCALNFPLGSLKLTDKILSHLKLTLNLSLLLLKTSLKLTKSGLKFSLDRVKVRDLLLSRDKILIGLVLSFSNVLLLLVELVDNLILLCNFIIQSLDGVVSGSLFLLNLADSKLNVFNVLLDNTNGARMLLDFSSKFNSGGFLRGKGLLGLGKLHLTLSLHGGSLGLTLSVDLKVSLLTLKLLGKLLNVVSHAIKFSLKGSSDIKGILVLTIGGLGLLFKLSKLFLGVGHSNERTSLLNDDKPSPISHA